MNSLRRYGFVAGLLLTLSACTSVPIPHTESGNGKWLGDPAQFTQSSAVFSELSNWVYQAKVSIKTSDASEQANLVWRYNNDSHELRLFGPLGAGAVKIQFDSSGVVLSDNNGTVHRGKSAEALLTRIAGWPIPIDALTYWLFALPNPSLGYRYQVDEIGQVTQLQQLGWTIGYSSYQPYHNKQNLPRKLVATKSLRKGGQVVVRIVSKGWEW